MVRQSRSIFFSLRLRLGLLLFVFAVALAMTLVILISQTGERWLQANVGAMAASGASHVADEIERGLGDRTRELTLAASQILDPNTSVSDQRDALARIQARDPDFVWLGIASRDGTILAATAGVQEGARASDRPWFNRGLQGEYAGPVHDGSQLAQALALAPEPLHVVDVSTPLKDSSGRVWGVLSGSLSASWMKSVEDSVIASAPVGSRADLLIASPTGEVILPPRDASGLTAAPLSLSSLTEASNGRSGFLVEQWPDKETYLVGFAGSGADPSFSGPRWVVLRREDLDLTLAPVRNLEHEIVFLGVLAAAVFGILGVVIATRVMSPLAVISRVARRIEGGDRDARIPYADGKDEIAALARSLRMLTGSLASREREVQGLASTLERRVAERMAELSAANDRLEQLSGTDALTGLPNRRQFNATLDREWQRAIRYQLPVALMLADIDHFKLYNDTYGHQAGDECLRRVSAAFAQAIARSSDLPARYGGEEFGIILTHTDIFGAMQMAERLLQTVRNYRIPHRASLVKEHVTISLGVACVVPGPDDKAEDLIHMADEALYQAKEQGRNRAVVAPMRVSVEGPPAVATEVTGA